jgi:hypothetical protein
VVGRWVSKDPIGFSSEQANLYGYAGFDPINVADPDGRQAIPIPVPPVIIAGGLALLGGIAIYGILTNNPDAVSDFINACKPDSAPPDCTQVRGDCITECTKRVLETPWRRNRDRGPDYQKCVQKCLRDGGC